MARNADCWPFRSAHHLEIFDMWDVCSCFVRLDLIFKKNLIDCTQCDTRSGRHTHTRIMYNFEEWALFLSFSRIHLMRTRNRVLAPDVNLNLNEALSSNSSIINQYLRHRWLVGCLIYEIALFCTKVLPTSHNLKVI